MKKIIIYSIFASLILIGTSCSDYLDINDNPNQATSSTPDRVLPQALTNSGAIASSFNTYGSSTVGYIANAGGFAGFGSLISYSFATTDYAGLFTSSYDNINDYQYVLDQTKSDKGQIYLNSIARIMRVYMYQKLVDTYNDIPYTDAIKGSGSLSPKYDKAEDIYKDLILQCDTAINNIIAGQAASTTNKVLTSADPVFAGDMDRWKQFANTLQLKLLIRVNEVASLTSFVSPKFSSFRTAIGVIADDVIVNPGYATEDGKQNPQFNTFAYTSPATNITVTGAGRSRLPERFVYGFYNGNKLDDAGRGSVIYRSFPNTRVNHLGTEGSNVPEAPTGFPSWFTGASANSNALGVLKGRTQGQPLLLAAEGNFLLAEAISRNKIVGDAAGSFRLGIINSFKYLYKDVTGKVDAAKNPISDADAYIAANAVSRLVNFTLAVSTTQKIEAIITQKYIANNFISGDESFNEFRRTAYPAIVNGSSDGNLSFASSVSTSTRADKLPARILYPNTEYQLNATNVPSSVSPFTNRIFWDLN